MTPQRPTNHRSRKITLWMVVALPLLALVAASIPVGLQWRQIDLDYRLVQAVKNLDAPAVNRLLSEGASANARDTGEPPLTMHRLLTRLLARLQYKPDHVAEDRGDPALLLLITNDHLYFGQKNRTVLDPKVMAVVDAIAASLVLHGANVHVLGYRQETPVADVAAYGLHHTLRLMLSKGVDVNTHNNLGLTPLMGADAYSATLLIQYGADVNATDLLKRRALHYVQDVDAAKVLIRHGAKVNSTDEDGLSILYCWENNRMFGDWQAIIRLLKQHGARLNTRDKEAFARNRERLGR